MTEPKTHKPISNETRAKISTALIGKPLSDEHRAKLSAALIGKHRPDAIRKKISDSHKALGETEHLRRLHSLGGRTGVAGRLNKGKRWVAKPSSNEESYLSPDEVADLVATGSWRWGRRRRR